MVHLAVSVTWLITRDGTYALEFGVTVAGRWILSVRINGQPLIEGGIAFHVAFGTLTTEEADITLNPALDVRCSRMRHDDEDLFIIGAGFEVNKRLMTGLSNFGCFNVTVGRFKNRADVLSRKT